MTTAVGVLSGLLLAALAGFAAAIASSRALRRRMDIKTREIEAELARREQAEKALLQRETHLRNVLLNADAVVFQLSPDGCIAHIEGRALGRIGLAPELVTGRPVADFFGDNPDVMGSLQRVLGGESVRYATTIRDRHAAIMASPSFDDAGRVTSVWGVATDVTERKETEHRYRVLFETARDAIAILRDGRFVDCNPWSMTLAGYTREELLGRRPEDFAPPTQPDGRSSAEAHDRVLEQAAHEPTFFEWAIRHKKGHVVHLEVSLVPTPTTEGVLHLAVARDMTERKNLQEVMIRTEKMATLGSLAAGMAHEINNPLGIILQAAQGTIKRLDPDAGQNIEAAARCGVDLRKVSAYMEDRNILRYLAGIREAGERAAAIVHGMLGFSRQSGQDKEMADVAALVGDSLALAAKESALARGDDFARIAIVKDLAPDLPAAPCAPAQIRQALLNLLRNAVQALGAARTPDPAITVAARRDQDHVVIEVADNGPGIPPEYADKVFEPFFTTKKPGEGTGLGLAVSYFLVVKNHGGRLEAASRPGAGAVFTIRLPLTPPPPGP